MFKWTRCLDQEIENSVNGINGLILITEELMIIGKNSKVTMSGKLIIGRNYKILGELGDQTTGVEVGVDHGVDHGALGAEDDIL